VNVSNYKLQDDQVTEFFASAVERHNIFLRREAGEPMPWTTDPAFLKWRFCNVFREDDKTTIWIRDNVRERLRNNHRVLLAMVICRFFNRIGTLERLQEAGLFDKWDSSKARKCLKNYGHVTSAAYIISSPKGLKKLDGILQIIDNFAGECAAILTRMSKQITIEEFWEILQRFPHSGQFMSYEIVSDLRHTHLLENASDIMTWACPGPGACRGLSWLVNTDLHAIKYGGSRVRRAAVDLMRQILVLSQHPPLWPSEWPRWEMREVEHWLCEYAKYTKITHLGKRMKRRYMP
jgi:hypothetical protein